MVSANGVKKNRHGIIVRGGEVRDAPAIVALRADWYEKAGIPIIPIPPQAVWMVAEWALDGKVVACMAVIAPELGLGVTYIPEMFCDPSRQGKLGLKAFLEKLHDLPGKKATSVPIRNTALLDILHGAGYRDVEIVLEEGLDCQQPLPDPSSEASSGS
jgi:hypothetical protein